MLAITGIVFDAPLDEQISSDPEAPPTMQLFENEQSGVPPTNSALPPELPPTWLSIPINGTRAPLSSNQDPLGSLVDGVRATNGEFEPSACRLIPDVSSTSMSRSSRSE